MNLNICSYVYYTGVIYQFMILCIFICCNISDCQNNATVEPDNCTCVCKNNWSGEKCGKFDLELTIDISSRTTCGNAFFVCFTFLPLFVLFCFVRDFFVCLLLGFCCLFLYEYYFTPILSGFYFLA